MVDLEALDAEDVDLLHALVRGTSSTPARPSARRCSRTGARAPARFTKVMPRDYKNVLLARARALEAGFGEDSQETLDAIMEASRG